jgi:hypothetical protein
MVLRSVRVKLWPVIPVPVPAESQGWGRNGKRGGLDKKARFLSMHTRTNFRALHEHITEQVKANGRYRVQRTEICERFNLPPSFWDGFCHFAHSVDRVHTGRAVDLSESEFCFELLDTVRPPSPPLVL